MRPFRRLHFGEKDEVVSVWSESGEFAYFSYEVGLVSGFFLGSSQATRIHPHAMHFPTKRILHVVVIENTICANLEIRVGRGVTRPP